MAFGYDLALGSEGSYTLIRRGVSPRRVAQIALGIGLAGLLVAIVIAPLASQSDGMEPLPLVFLILSGVSLCVGVQGLAWELARAPRLIERPRQVIVEPPHLRVGRHLIPTSEVTRIEIHKVPIPRDNTVGVEHRYIVGIVTRSQVIELLFDDLMAAKDVGFQLAVRMGLQDPLGRVRPMFRGYGCLLALPTILGIFAMVFGCVGLMLLEMDPWPTALLSAGSVVLINLVVFLLTWWVGRPAARKYVETEYGVLDT